MKYIILSVTVLCVQSVKLPSNFPKCNRKEPDFKQCVLEAAKCAVPQLIKPFKNLNIPSLKPLNIPEATVRAGQGTVTVDQNFKNCKFYGFEQLKFDKFEFDFGKKVLAVKGVFPAINMKCQYQLHGKILLFPIKGDGNSTIVLENLKISTLMTYIEVSKNGKMYIKFLDSALKMDPSLVTFNFENLFGGDTGLGDNINKVINDNWKEVFDDVKSDYVKIVTEIVIDLMNKFFSKVSIEEAFD